MIDRVRSIGFVRAHATPQDLARVDYFLDGKTPGPDVVDGLFAGQNPDSRWPAFWSGDQSSLDATCYRIAQAEGLGLTGQEPVRAGAIPFLIRRQQQDGSWEEDEALAGAAPSWAKPGDEAARLYLTANCGYWLTVLTTDSDVVLRASGYLLDLVDDDGHIPSFAQTHWLAAGLWYRIGQFALVERVMGYVADTFVPKLDTADLAWLMRALLTAGVPADASLLLRASDGLREKQRLDGSWPGAGDGPDIYVTLEALRALHALN